MVDSKDEADNKVLSFWWPEKRSEAEEKKRQAELVISIKDAKGSPGLYPHNEVLERIGGYDPVRGSILNWSYAYVYNRVKSRWPSRLLFNRAWC